MLPVLDNESMREADRYTIEELGVPGIVLMENAATGVVDALRESFPTAHQILILCGRGNNGGDGLAMARHLHNGGHQVQVLLFADPERLTPDGATNYRLARNFKVPIRVLGDDLGDLEAELAARPPELIVDALLGTGIDRPLAGRLLAVAEILNRLAVPVLAVDVPSGLSGSLSQVPGTIIEADLTVTFAALKRCHALPPACLGCGEIVVVDIGIPPATLEQDCRLWWLTAEDIALLLPQREIDAHKGRFGHLLIVGGATGRGGAVAMAGKGGVVAGAGLVTMAVPAPLVGVVDGACLEAMTLALDASEQGTISGPAGLAPLLERINAVVAGPGMGTGSGAGQTLQWLLDNWQGQLLLDADAVNLLAGDPHRLGDRQQPTVLTPHPGELARLLGQSNHEVVADRVAAARAAASQSGGVVVAKGFHTVVATADGEAWINPSGDSHLASGGSGDVLAGVIGAFLAQGLDPLRAALVGTWLHGRAGELGQTVDPAGVPAARLPELVAAAWQELAIPESGQE